MKSSPRQTKDKYCHYHKDHKKCSIDKCVKRAAINGLCNVHGDHHKCIFKDPSTGTSCERFIVFSGKFCHKHKEDKPKCTYKGCTTDAKTKRYCHRHMPLRKCANPNCNTKIKFKKFCSAHQSTYYCIEPDCKESCYSNSINRCQKHLVGRKCLITNCISYTTNDNEICNKHVNSHFGPQEVNNICAESQCNNPILHITGKRKFCDLHKSKPKINIRICSANYCIEQAVVKQSRYCAEHKINKICTWMNCISPIYKSSKKCEYHYFTCKYPDCHEHGNIFCAQHDKDLNQWLHNF